MGMDKIRKNRALLSLSTRIVPTGLVLSVGTSHEISFLTQKFAVKESLKIKDS